LLHFAKPSYKDLDVLNFCVDQNLFLLSKSTNSDCKSTSKSCSDLNDQKNRTDTPSTISYELVHETFGDAAMEENQNAVLKSIIPLQDPTENTNKIERKIINYKIEDTSKGKITNSGLIGIILTKVC
jgi:hypothetical protein